MPATVRELKGIEIGSGQNRSIRRRYLIRGAEDYEAADTALAEAAEPSFGGLILRDWTVTEIGGGTYAGSAIYTPTGESNGPKPLTPEDPEQWEFSTEGGTQRITQSISTVKSYFWDGDVVTGSSPFFGAIGVGKDGHVEGVDVDVAGGRIRARRVITAAQATPTYLNLLLTMRGGVNDAVWRGRAAGEVKFRVGNTQTRANGDVELVREWDVSPNATGIVVPNIPEPIDKDGWDLMNVYYEEKEDSAKKLIVRRPYIVMIERVYPRIDFGVLEPPGGP